MVATRGGRGGQVVAFVGRRWCNHQLVGIDRGAHERGWRQEQRWGDDEGEGIVGGEMAMGTRTRTRTRCGGGGRKMVACHLALKIIVISLCFWFILK